MECVTTTAASVLVNGSPTNEFKFGRWIRQGYSLSHFLYLLDVEGINVMMNATMKVGSLQDTELVDQSLICNLLMTLYL